MSEVIPVKASLVNLAFCDFVRIPLFPPFRSKVSAALKWSFPNHFVDITIRLGSREEERWRREVERRGKREGGEKESLRKGGEEEMSKGGEEESLRKREEERRRVGEEEGRRGVEEERGCEEYGRRGVEEEREVRSMGGEERRGGGEK